MSLYTEVIMFRLKYPTCEHMSNVFIGKAISQNKKTGLTQFDCENAKCSSALWRNNKGEWEITLSIPF